MAEDAWSAAARLVDEGEDPGRAVLRAGVRPVDVVRLAGPGARAWTDLVDVWPGQRVLLTQPAPSAAAVALARRGAAVSVGAPEPGQAAFWRAAGPDGVELLDADDLDSREGGFDLVCAEGRPASLRGLVRVLAPSGRLAVLCENLASPLRTADRLRAPTLGGAVAGVGALVRRAGRLGLGDAQVFGLLRSALAPTTAFDLSAPATATAVLEAGAVFATGRRHLSLRLLTALARRGVASSLVPAWLVVLGRPRGAPPAVRRTGRIGFIDSWEAKVVWGEPPEQLEKHYRSAEEAGRERDALEALKDAGVDVVPRVVSRPAPDRLVLTWLPGRTLDVASLADAELITWVGRAASTLRRLHSGAAEDDGTVLVHGDYWLGNLLVDGDRIVGVIDWAESRRGRPEEDLRFLVDSLVDLHPRAWALRGRLVEVAELAYATPTPA